MPKPPTLDLTTFIIPVHNNLALSPLAIVHCSRPRIIFRTSDVTLFKRFSFQSFLVKVEVIRVLMYIQSIFKLRGLTLKSIKSVTDSTKEDYIFLYYM